ncbi:Major facilitator superfamily [Methanocaldococcus lauensis]|uniref:Major facilitator superfamily n=2 Tax=Methanocaldococcus lauensis TaxID=2546128 RepID=A0A8D6PW14_9EURY|nr:Major facilitator superfamily [Methanocaldococcus lauensis]
MGGNINDDFNKISNLAVIWITTFTTMLGIGLIAPIMSIFAESLGATNTEIGIIFGVFALFRTISQIPVGILSDIFGKKPFIVIGTFFYGVFTLMYNIVGSVLGLLIIRSITGFFSAFVTPIAGSYVANLAPKERLGEYMGIFNASINLGFAIGPFIGGFLADMYGIQTPFYICGFLGILASIIALIKLEELPIKREVEININKLFSIEFLKNRLFLLSYIINTLSIISNASIIVYLAIYAVSFKITLTQVGFMIASTNILSALLQRYIGRLFDKFGIVVIILGIIILSIGMYLISLSTTFFTLIFSLMVVAIGMAMVGTSAMSLAIRDIPPERKGEAMGLFTTSFNIGMFFGAVIFGVLADFVGLSNMYKISSILVLFLGSLCYLKIKKQLNN